MNALFKDKVSGRKCTSKDIINHVPTLKTTLSSDDFVVKNTDTLDNCAKFTFGETDELENSGLTMYDDYVRAVTTTLEQDIVAEQSDNACHDNSASGSALKISLDNLFAQDREKMIEMKIPEVRLRKQSRVLRSRAFFLETSSSATNVENKLEIELNLITSV